MSEQTKPKKSELVEVSLLEGTYRTAVAPDSVEKLLELDSMFVEQGTVLLETTKEVDDLEKLLAERAAAKAAITRQIVEEVEDAQVKGLFPSFKGYELYAKALRERYGISSTALRRARNRIKEERIQRGDEPEREQGAGDTGAKRARFAKFHSAFSAVTEAAPVLFKDAASCDTKKIPQAIEALEEVVRLVNDTITALHDSAARAQKSKPMVDVSKTGTDN